MGALSLSVFHGEPGFWSGAHGTRPNPAPVYGLVKGRNGEGLDLGQEVMVHPQFLRGTPARATIVGIGDRGLPNRHVIKVRPFKSAYIETAAAGSCEPHMFGEYEWLDAETKAAAELGRKNVDLARASFGGFYFEEFQRAAMRHYLAARGAA